MGRRGGEGGGGESHRSLFPTQTTPSHTTHPFTHHSPPPTQITPSHTTHPFTHHSPLHTQITPSHTTHPFTHHSSPPTQTTIHTQTHTHAHNTYNKQLLLEVNTVLTLKGFGGFCGRKNGRKEMSTKSHVISNNTHTFATDGAAGLVGSWAVSTTIGCRWMCGGVECMCVCGGVWRC